MQAAWFAAREGLTPSRLCPSLTVIKLLIMSGSVNIRFFGDLNDFLPQAKKQTAFDHTFTGNGSVKDLIESVGVPHPEVDLILVNGQSVDFSHTYHDGDRISAYPVFTSINIETAVHLVPELLEVRRFVLDTHLGRLAAYLRMLGFDSLYRNDYDDPELADLSFTEKRILLTRDRKLLMRKQVQYGYFVRHHYPQQQLLEIVHRFNLAGTQQPFTRCMSCNGLLHPVDKRDIEEMLLPKTREHYNEFWQCADCRKVYWEGSHCQRMQKLVDAI